MIACVVPSARQIDPGIASVSHTAVAAPVAPYLIRQVSGALKLVEQERLLKRFSVVIITCAFGAFITSSGLSQVACIEDARIKATEEADRIVENARESINYEKLKAMHDLKNQIASLSIDIAEKLMKAELSDKQKADGIIHRELDEIHLN